MLQPLSNWKAKCTCHQNWLEGATGPSGESLRDWSVAAAALYADGCGPVADVAMNGLPRQTPTRADIYLCRFASAQRRRRKLRWRPQSGGGGGGGGSGGGGGYFIRSIQLHDIYQVFRYGVTFPFRIQKTCGKKEKCFENQMKTNNNCIALFIRKLFLRMQTSQVCNASVLFLLIQLKWNKL